MIRAISLLLISIFLFSCSSSRKKKENISNAQRETAQSAVDAAAAAVLEAADSIEKDMENAVAENIIREDTVIDKSNDVIHTARLISQAPFQYLQFKAKANYYSSKQNIPFSAYIRIEHGKRIWASVIGGGVLEVGRALITPDSVFVIDKLNKTVYIRDATYLRELVGIDVDYATLESILTSQLPDVIEGTISQKNDAQIEIQQQVNESVISRYNIDKKKKTWNYLEIDFENMDVKNAIAQYENYSSVGSLIISMLRKVTISTSDSESIRLLMDISKVVVDQKPNMSFPIPEGFELN